MKLLICTQAVDQNDPILGFFVRWIEELAKHCEHVTVVCLREGEYSLPKNVSVHSLQKGSKFTRAWKLVSFAWNARHQYDRVFVHMNQEYIVASGLLWRLLGRPIYFWRNHYAGSSLTKVAVWFCSKVFYTSAHSYTARFKRAVQMPVGVDTGAFRRMSEISRDDHGVLFLGRIAPSKKPELLLKALELLKAKGVNARASFIGPMESDAYRASLQRMAKEAELSVRWSDGVPNAQTPQEYNRHGIFVNCSASGMYDKTIFEAMACECLVLASSRDFAALAGEQRFAFKEDDAEDLARALDLLLRLPSEEWLMRGAQLRSLAEAHSLAVLGTRLAEEMQ